MTDSPNNSVEAAGITDAPDIPDPEEFEEQDCATCDLDSEADNPTDPEEV